MSMREAQYLAKFATCLERQAIAAHLAAEGEPTGRQMRAAEHEEARILAACRNDLGSRRAAHIHAEAIARTYAAA